MVINKNFHNAIILSIVFFADKRKKGPYHWLGIYDIIKLIISQTNHVLSPGDIYLTIDNPGDSIKNFKNGIWSGGRLEIQPQHHATSIGDKKIFYREWLLKVDQLLEDGWGDINWLDLMTYLLFIQSNTHHKGHINSSILCRNSNSFLNFFYKTKNGFNPGKGLPWPSASIRNPTPKIEFIGDWWVRAFERDKEEMLMFRDLAPSGYMKDHRTTTGWFVRPVGNSPGDCIPSGNVVNQLRNYYVIPILTGDYGLGCMSADRKNIDFEPEKNKNENNDIIYICDTLLQTLGIAVIGFWLFNTKSN